jgi:two-component system, NtrC family, sensor histidine kinase HydH
MNQTDPDLQQRIDSRAEHHLAEHHAEVHTRTDRMFAFLMMAQWIAAVGLALWVSPRSWAGSQSQVHVHVYAAVFLGLALNSLPVFLVWRSPGSALTRHVIACSQMLWSALLIHLTGGRIETHFHVFGSLAFLGFYRDWKILPGATLVVASDHLIRQLFWPESVYGMVNPEWWRFLEHAFWVGFIDFFVVLSCRKSVEEMQNVALRRAEAETYAEQEREKSVELALALEHSRAGAA